MSKLWRALELGLEILTDIEALVAGTAASFTFSWQGKKFSVTINPVPPAA